MRISEKQMEYLVYANHRWNFKGGATRSGKTYLDVKWVIPMRIRERVGKAGLSIILGVTKSTIERNVLSPMRSIYGEALVGRIGSDNRVQLFGESCYALGAEKLTQVSKIRGASVKYCYGDEVADWSEEVFSLLKSRLDQPYSLFDGTYNPAGPGHWLKKFLDSGADTFSQVYTLFDNPFLSADFRDNLCREYGGTVYYDRYVLGKWALAEGLVYDFKDAYTVTHVPEAFEKGEYYISVDYGTMNPFSAGLWVVAGDRALRLKEFYHSGRESGKQMTDEAYADAVLSLAGERTIRQVIVDPSAASFIASLRQRGLRVRQANNAVADGIRRVATYLAGGHILIHRDCEDCIREFGLYRWDNASGEDRVLKENDHAMDEVRYFANTVLRHKVRRERGQRGQGIPNEEACLFTAPL